MANNKSGSFLKNNWFFFTMLLGIVLGIVALTSDAAGAFLVAIPVGLALVLMGVGYIALDVAFIRMDKAGETPKYFKDVDDAPKEA